MDKVVAGSYIFSTIVKLQIIGELHSSLIIHADRSRRREDRWRTSDLRRLPLYRRIIVMFSYICRKRFNMAGFDFAEESPHPDDLLSGLGDSDVLRFSHGQGDNVLLLSLPRDRTSA